MDLGSALFPALYSTFGTPLSFERPSDGASVTVTAINETGGAAGALSLLHEIQAGTIRPVAIVRIKELVANDVDFRDMEGVDVTLNGETWTVVTVQLGPGPAGQIDGEAFLMLSLIV